ncbi:EAL domain-containing protein [Undibacterium arcticum]
MNHVSKLHEVTTFHQFRPRPSRVFIAEMAEMIDAADGADAELGILVMSIDQLKSTTCRQFDPDMEVAILDDITRKIASCMGPFGQFTRNDDDDFLICFPIQSLYDVVELAAKIQALIAQPVHAFDQEFRLTASIGATVYPQDKGTPRDMLFHALEAMGEVRQQGGNRFKIFDFAQRVAQIHARTLSDAVMDGMRNGQIELHYQPTIDLCSGRPIGVEVLMRWRQTPTVMRNPIDFLPSIVGDDLLALDMYVLDAALRQSVAWQGLNIEPALSVNLSPPVISPWQGLWTASSTPFCPIRTLIHAV